LAGILSRDEEWNINLDEVEAAEVSGVTSRSAVLPVDDILNGEGGFLRAVWQSESETSTAIGSGQQSAAGLPDLRVLASPETRRPRCFVGSRWRCACGHTAAGHLRRVVGLAAVFESLLWLEPFGTLTGSSWGRTAGTITSVAVRTLTTLAVVVIAWYWVRIARSAARLRSIHERTRLRDVGLVGASHMWIKGISTGGLAAPFDATADPHARSILALTLVVAALWAIIACLCAVLDAASPGCSSLITEGPRLAICSSVALGAAVIFASLSGSDVAKQLGKLAKQARDRADTAEAEELGTRRGPGIRHVASESAVGSARAKSEGRRVYPASFYMGEHRGGRSPTDSRQQHVDRPRLSSSLSDHPLSPMASGNPRTNLAAADMSPGASVVPRSLIVGRVLFRVKDLGSEADAVVAGSPSVLVEPLRSTSQASSTTELAEPRARLGSSVSVSAGGAAGSGKSRAVRRRMRASTNSRALRSEARRWRRVHASLRMRIIVACSVVAVLAASYVVSALMPRSAPVIATESVLYAQAVIRFGMMSYLWSCTTSEATVRYVGRCLGVCAC